MPARRRSTETGALARRQTPAALPHAAATPSALRWEPEAWAGHVAQRPADPAITPAQAEKVASQVDFRFELASASNHYEALGQCVRDIKAAAEHFRSEWQVSGDRDCLAKAQHLPIRGTLLDSLHALRAHHKDWLSSTPVVSPATLAYLLRFFRDALRACEAQPDAVKLLPMAGVHAALAHMQTQVEASQQSLATGQWQTTVEGQWHAEKFRARQARDPGARSPLTDPFDEVKVACQELGQIVAGLLVHGPAAEPPKETAAAIEPVPQAQAQAPEQGPSVPAAPSQAVTTPPGVWDRSFKSVLIDGLPVPLRADTGPRQPTVPATRNTAAGPATRHPQATQATPRRDPAPRQIHRPARDRATTRSTAPVARPAETRPGHEKRVDSGASSQARQSANRQVLPKPADFTSLPTPEATPPSVAAVIAAPPADPAAEAAARLRQQQIDALHDALATLQTKAEHSLEEARGVRKAATAPGGLPWSGSSLELAAWRAAGEAHDQWERELPKAGALVGLDRGDPEMRRLEQKISEATRSVLASVAKAADNELAAVSRACNAALTRSGPPNEGSMSHADLAARCDELRDQWKEEENDTSLGSQIPGQSARMEQYSAYDLALSAMHGEPVDVAAALDKAEQLRKATLSPQRASPGTQGALADPLSTFHKFCTQARSKLLLKAVHLQIKDVEATYVKLGTPLAAPRDRSRQIAAACDVLLVGDPLPDMAVQVPRPQTAPSRPATDKAGADRLVRQAEVVGALARAQREQHKEAIKLPDDAPQQVVRELEAGLAVLSQLELTSRTAAETITRFRELSGTPGNTGPTDQLALVARQHAEALEQLAAARQQVQATPHAEAVQQLGAAQQHAKTTERLVMAQQLAETKEREATVQQHAEAMEELAQTLYRTMRAQDDLVTRESTPWVRDLVERSNALLRADHRHVGRMQASLEALERLLHLRMSALEIRQEFNDGKLDRVARPEVAGSRHEWVRGELKSDMQLLAQLMEREEHVITLEALLAEKALHDDGASALERRIDSEMIAMQAKFLVAWAAKAREPDSGYLTPAQVPILTGRLTALGDALVDNNKKIKKHAASSEHKDKYEAQIAINNDARRSLQTLKSELLKLDPAEAPAPGSSQADEPAAQARRAPQKGQSSRHSRQPRHR